MCDYLALENRWERQRFLRPTRSSSACGPDPAEGAVLTSTRGSLPGLNRLACGAKSLREVVVTRHPNSQDASGCVRICAQLSRSPVILVMMTCHPTDSASGGR